MKPSAGSGAGGAGDSTAARSPGIVADLVDLADLADLATAFTPLRPSSMQASFEMDLTSILPWTARSCRHKDYNYVVSTHCARMYMRAQDYIRVLSELEKVPWLSVATASVKVDGIDEVKSFEDKC
jgi:hypothetical protein